MQLLSVRYFLKNFSFLVGQILNGTLGARRVARNSQWGGCFGGLGAKPPAAGGWGFGGKAPSRRRQGGLGAEHPALENFAVFLQK